MCFAVLLTGHTTPPAGIGAGGISCQSNLKCGARLAASPGGGLGRRENPARTPTTPKTVSTTLRFCLRLGTFFSGISDPPPQPLLNRTLTGVLADVAGSSINLGQFDSARRNLRGRGDTAGVQPESPR